MATKKKARTDPYQEVRDGIMDKLEEIDLVRRPTVAEYLEALKSIRSDVNDWFESAIGAAREDLQKADDEEAE